MGIYLLVIGTCTYGFIWQIDMFVEYLHERNKVILPYTYIVSVHILFIIEAI
jgi:hypothetical protein